MVDRSAVTVARTAHEDQLHRLDEQPLHPPDRRKASLLARLSRGKTPASQSPRQVVQPSLGQKRRARLRFGKWLLSRKPPRAQYEGRLAVSKTTVAVAMSLLLLGCAASPEESPPNHAASLADDGYGDAVGHSDHQEPNVGQWTVAVIGTPFYLAFKTAACGVSLVVAAPAAAVSALAGRSYGMLEDGIAANCGPPYVLSPS